MSRKNLPKAIRRTAEDMSWAGGGASPAAKAAAPARSAELSVVTGGKPAAADPDAGAGATIIEATPTTTDPTPVAETVTAVAADAPDQPTPAAESSAASRAARRRSIADAIVERHATYSAVGGAIPMPLVNFASMTGIIVRMVKRLSSLYDVPFDRRRARAIVTGLTGGAALGGFSVVTASALAYVTPVGLVVGVAASSIAAAASTRWIGRMFVEHFERGATLQDFPAVR
jgi:uncharacterized protein (DUF697 family)